MPLFELDEGRLVPAQYGRPVTEPVEPDAVEVVREQLLEIVARPLFPVRRATTDAPAGNGNTTAPREPDLIALDPDGQPVVAAVTDRIDAATLVWILGQAGLASRMSWAEIAQGYPGGVAAFRAEWAGFRESAPRGPGGPPAVLVAFGVDDDVRPALEVLAPSGVRVIELVVRSTSSGRRFIDAVEVRRSSVSAARTVITPSSPRRMLGAAGPASEPEPVTPTVSIDLDSVANLRLIGGALTSDVDLAWHDGAEGPAYTARLTTDGLIVLPDGARLTDPSEAAAQTSGRADVDGWSVWRIGDGGPTLGEARAELQAAAARRSAPPEGRRRRRA